MFVRLVDNAGVERYSAVYKGEVIVPNGSSKELRKSLDGAWNKTGDDLVEELDEIRLDFVTKDMSVIRLTKLEFEEWAAFIRRRGANVRFVDENPTIAKHFTIENAGAAFQADTIPPTIWVIRDNVSDLQMFHESMHFEDYLKRGRKNYLKGKEKPKVEVTGIAPKAQASIRDQLVNKYIREKYVLDKILEEQKAWKTKKGYGRFSVREMAGSIEYFKEYEQMCIDFGIKIKDLEPDL